MTGATRLADRFRSLIRTRRVWPAAIAALVAMALILPMLPGAGPAASSPSARAMALAEAQAVSRVNSALLDMIEAEVDSAVVEENEAQLIGNAIPPEMVISYEFAAMKYLRPEQAELERELAEAKLAGTRANLDLQVTSVYLGLLTAERFNDLALEGLARAQDHVALTQKLEQTGLVAHKDVLDAQAQEAEAAGGVAATRRGLETARLGLLRLLGDGRAECPVPDASSVNIALDDKSVAEWVADATSARYEAKQVRGYMDLAERALELAETYPAGMAMGASFAGIPGLPPELSPDPSWDRSNRYTIPLAEASLRQAKAGRTMQLEEIEFQVRTAYLEVEESVEKDRLLAPAVDAAREGLRLAGLRYEMGMATNLEVRAAELALRSAETNDLQAQLNRQLARAKLNHVSGHGYRASMNASGGM